MILFIVYTLFTFCLACFFAFYEKLTIKNFNYDENASSLVVVFKAIAFSAEAAVNGMGVLLRYIITITLLNVFFYAALMFIKRFSIKELIFLISVTLSLSFFLFLLIVAIFQWSLGEYFTIACPLLVTTFYIVRKTRLFFISDNKLFEL
ncbi:MAG: hypothetical protein ABI921_00250 [Panacibacter sp.]